MKPHQGVLVALAAIGALSLVSVLMQDFVMDRVRGRHVDAAMLAQALGEASGVKRAVAAYYADFGRFPDDNRALGLGPPESFARDALVALEVVRGQVVMRFGEPLNEDAVVVLRPRSSHAGVGDALRWTCESAAFAERVLETAAPQCKRVETVKLDEPAPTPVAPHSIEDLVSALHLRRRGLVREIIRSGVDANLVFRGWLPLQIAIDQGDADTVDELVRAGANADQELDARDGMTVLMYAAAANRQSGRILRALIRSGANLNARDDNGVTALMHAARTGNTPAIEILMAAGAALEALDNRGKMALDHAAANGTSSAAYRRLKTAGQKSNEIIVVIPERE